MKLSDYVIDFLAQRGVTHVFGMSGGAAVHLFDSAERHPAVTPIFSQHEQSSAISADGYARLTGRLGVAITTSGPGATNLLTGVCCSYYDSIPTLMITGQVATYRMKGDHDIRQLGFQETDVLSIFGTVTKYAAQVRDPGTIRYHLERACHTAFDARPGSVLIDIPDDLQRAEIDPETLDGYLPLDSAPAGDLEDEIARLATWAAEAERPAIILGGGLSSPRCDESVRRLLEHLGWPVLQTWAALDVMEADHPLRIGPFGVYGPRLGNFVVQNADLVLCLGTRLSQNCTGAMLSAFARAAKVVMIDASCGEMSKFDGRGLDIALRIEGRLDAVLPRLIRRLPEARPDALMGWHACINAWRKDLPDDRPTPATDEAGVVDAYDFVDALSRWLPADEALTVDTGGTLTWTCNGIRLKPGQRLISAWNNTPMGYALPAAIGAALSGRAGVTCVTGDGGLMLCLGELASLARHRLNVKVVVFDNRGHGIQRQTLDTWLESRYVGVDEPSGLAFADFVKVGEACGLPTVVIDKTSEIDAALGELYAMIGPALCVVRLRQDQRLHPFLKFGTPLEDQSPPMERAALRAAMIVAPYAPAAGASEPKPTIGL